MAVVAWGDAIGCASGQDLFGFQAAILSTGILITGLEKTASASAAVIVGFVGCHVDEIFFTHNGLDHVPQVFSHRVAEGFSYKLAGVLDREFNLQVFIPVGIDLELSFPDPLGVILNDAFDFEIEGDFELLRSEPDREEFVPSLRIEPDLAFKVLHGLHLNLYDMLPCWVVSHEHAVVFSRPSFGAICPVRAHRMKDFP
jgi:hypothetical protein